MLASLSPSSAQEVVVRPKVKLGPLDNPLKGWCPYTDAGPITQPYSMVFQYISWRELEPTKNDFRFEQWESSWNSDAGKDKHIIFRVYIDYPGKPSGLPDWLRDEGVEEYDYTDYGGGKSPNYNSEQMIKAIEHLIAALGDRYNQNPRIAFIQLGLLGFWGEWHTYPRTELYASTETEARIINAYRKAFPSKSLMVRYARDFAGKQNWIGFHDDMFPEDTDNGKDWSFLAGLRREARTENWQRAVVGGEMVPGKAKKWLISDFDTTLTMLNRSHFTWIGPYCPALEEGSRNTKFKANSELLVRNMGYNFEITELSHPTATSGSMTIKLTGENTGVAPFYYPWSVEYALINPTGKVEAKRSTSIDIRTWKPGPFTESTTLDFGVASGMYKLAIGIRDPWKDRPAIKFANELEVIDGWNVVSELQISQPEN